jgi:hypothetical protein
MAHAPSERNASSPTGYTLALIALALSIAGLGLAYGATAYFDRLADMNDDPTLATTHLVTIGAQHYAVPAVLMAVPSQRTDGFSERLDLGLALPLGADEGLVEIDVAIMPRGRARTSAHLLDTVYVHQFATEQVPGPPGLVGKPLNGDAGYGGETVWYDPLAATPFVAKCMAPVAGDASRKTCLRTVLLSDRNAAIFSFAPEVLENWRQFDATVEGWLEGLRR